VHLGAGFHTRFRGAGYNCRKPVPSGRGRTAASGRPPRPAAIAPKPGVKQFAARRPVSGVFWCGGEADGMNTRRMLSWWFRVVLSGRFLERFLYVQRAERS